MPQPLGSLRQRPVSSADRSPRASRRTDPMLRVLFIAKDPGIAELYRLKLELDGYQVDVVPMDGPVLERARTHQPDLIFADVRVPDPDAIAPVHAIRREAELQTVPLIILTGDEAFGLERSGLALSSLDYIIRVEDLAAAS